MSNRPKSVSRSSPLIDGAVDNTRMRVCLNLGSVTKETRGWSAGRPSSWSVTVISPRLSSSPICSRTDGRSGPFTTRCRSPNVRLTRE